MNSVFGFSSYKDFLRSRIALDQNRWGLLTKLSQAAGCHRPYLSKVLSTEAHLTASQLFGLASYWELQGDERDYLLCLLEFERAASVAYRNYWKQKLTVLKQQHENIAKLVKRQEHLPTEMDFLYYSVWYYSAVHVLVSIPEFCYEQKIAERLNLSNAKVREVLSDLEKWGAVRKEGKRWIFNSREQHLPKHSPLVSLHHANWRQRAQLSSQKVDSENIHYTVVQSISRSDYLAIKELVFSFIRKTSAIAGPSSEEVLMCLNCDFFAP